MPDFEVLSELLMWIVAGGGAAILAGRAVALFLEDLQWWHTLSPFIKKWAVRVFSLVFAVLADALLQVDLSALLGQFSGLASILLLAIWNWFASQQQYISIKDGTYAEAARAPKVGP